MKLRSFLSLSLTIVMTCALAQNPLIEWQKALGGSDIEAAESVAQTSDGGYIAAGWTFSNNGDVSGNHGNGDVWVVKLDEFGTIVWQNALGGTGIDGANAVKQTSDGGYILAGWTNSNDGDVSGYHGNGDYWVLKLNALGGLVWQKALGGSAADFAKSVGQTSDGGYIVVGETRSNDGDVSGNNGYRDFWLVKLNSSGDLQWQKAYGGISWDVARSVAQTSDGGYILAGETRSIDGDVTGNHGSDDFWVVKVDSLGNLQWQNALGGSDSELAYSVEQTDDGGYVVAGHTWSNDGDVVGYHGSGDCWLVKLDSLGNLLWQNALGGSSYDHAHSVGLTSDGSYVLAGVAHSNDGDVSGNHGFDDFWVLGLDSLGDPLWQKALGGSDLENATSVQQTSDGGYLVAGWTFSNDGDVSGINGSRDIWVVKLAPLVSTGIESPSGASVQQGNLYVFPNPTAGKFQLSVETGFIESILVSDAAGREVLRKKLKTNSVLVDLTDHPQGEYLIKVRMVDGSILQKLVIKQ